MKGSDGGAWVQGAYCLSAGVAHCESLREPLIRRAIDAFFIARGLGPEHALGRAHNWAPWGLSYHLVAAPVRIVIHTWPERALCTLDILADEARFPAQEFINYLEETLGWRAVEQRLIERGVIGAQER